MQVKLINEQGRVYALVFSTGEDPMAGLARFAAEHKLSASNFTAIGAFSEALLGYFDWEKKAYERIPVREQTEVLALVGDVTLDDAGGRKVHAHVVLGKRDGRSRNAGPRGSERDARDIAAYLATLK